MTKKREHEVSAMVDNSSSEFFKEIASILESAEARRKRLSISAWSMAILRLENASQRKSRAENIGQSMEHSF